MYFVFTFIFVFQWRCPAPPPKSIYSCHNHRFLNCHNHNVTDPTFQRETIEFFSIILQKIIFLRVTTIAWDRFIEITRINLISNFSVLSNLIPRFLKWIYSFQLLHSKITPWNVNQIWHDRKRKKCSLPLWVFLPASLNHMICSWFLSLFCLYPVIKYFLNILCMRK